MRIVLDLVRIIVIFTLVGGIAWYILGQVYTNNGIEQKDQWYGIVGIYILLFVYYRNRLQFTGWYKGKRSKKLSKASTWYLIIIAVLCIGAPFLFS